MSVLSAPRFHDPVAALEHVEAMLWPDGPTCPHCGAADRFYTLKGKSTKPGVRKCGHCLKLFTVTVGTGILTSGEIEANVDFASGKLDSTWYVFTPTATDSSAKINFRAEDVPIDGRTFAGRATSDRGHSGTIEGGFFGVQSVFHTRAPEIAGRFDLEGSAGSVTGAFAAGGSCDAGICPSPASPTPPPPQPPTGPARPVPAPF